MRFVGKALLAASMMMALSLAGCADSEATGPSDQVQVKGTNALDGLGNGTGAIIGVVYDEFGEPIPAATVALLSTPFEVKTNDTGGFELVQVDAFDYTMRVRAAGYQDLETPVTVEDGVAAELVVTLLADASVSGDARAHVHDYWAGEATRTVIDGTYFEYHEAQADGTVWGPTMDKGYETVVHTAIPDCIYDGTPYFPNRQIQFDNGAQLLWAGTESIDVTVSWEAQDWTGTAVRMAWKGAAAAGFSEGDAFGSGETYTIQVDPSDWDVSHQTRTAWQFWLCTADGEALGTVTGGFTVTMSINRMDGKIPLEAAHPTFWPDDGRLNVRNPESDGEVTFDYIYALDRNTRDSPWVVKPNATSLIPPGTGKIVVDMAWDLEYLGVGPAGAAMDLVHDVPWTITYRPAGIPYEEMSAPGDLMAATLVTDEDHHRVYEIDVEFGDWDQFYQKRSNWVFMLNMEGREADDQYVSECGGLCSYTFDISIDAFRDPSYA